MFDLFGARDPQKALSKAQEYINDGRLDSAIKVLEKNVTEDEESFDVYLNLARLYFETEERDRAVETLRTVKSVVPSRVDEIATLLSELYYQQPSIDAGDFLLQLHIIQQRYEELSKTLRCLSERELKLLSTRYEKIKQNIEKSNVVSKRDFEHMLILASLKFFIGESEQAVDAIDAISDIDVYAPRLLKWIRVISRERYNDWRTAMLMMRFQIANKDFEGAISTAERTAERSADSVNSLIATISSAKPPKDLEATYAQFLTDLYIKKGDLDVSIDLLQDLLKKDTKKIDDVIKGLRELERINPNDLKILYALGDTYVKANRISLAMSEFNKILEMDETQYEQVMLKYKAIFEKEPNNPEILDNLIGVYLSKNDIDSAVDAVETAYKSDPGLLAEYIINLNAILEHNLDNARALYLLGLCYAHNGDHGNALVIFENLMDNEEFKYVRSAAEKICEESPDDLRYLNLRAKSMIMLGAEKDALSLLASYIEENPDKTASLLPTFDALISRKPGLAQEILPIYKRYKKDDPFVADLAFARAYAFTGEHKKAVGMFEKLAADEEHKDTVKRALIEAIQERPKAVPLLLAAARIFMKEGEMEVATQFFKTAQKVDPKAFFEIVDEFYDALKHFPKDREVRILLVDTFFDRKLWDRVIDESKRAIEVFGEDTQYFSLKLGEALVENGNLSDAVRPLMLSLDDPEDYSGEVIEYLDKILGIDKSNVPAHFARGRALSKAHRLDEAVEEYLLTVRILPARAVYVHNELKTLSSKAKANPLVMFALGRVELLLKKYDNAVRHLLESCELDVALVKRVIPLYEKLFETTSTPLLEFSLARAYHLANLRSSAVKYYIKAQADEKSYREPVISELKKICAESPDDIESRKGLAEVYFDYNDMEDSLDLVDDVYRTDSRESEWAKKFVSNILRRNPQHILSYYFLAYVFLNEEKYKKAIEVYRKLIEMSPSEITKVIKILEKHKEKSRDFILYLGNLHIHTGEIEKAIEQFDELFALDTGFGSEIIPQIEQILSKNAEVGEAYLLAYRIYVVRKEYEKAVEAIKHAEELIPDNEEIVLKEGQMYYEMGSADKAVELYTKLLNNTKNRKAIYRLIRKTRTQYLENRIETLRSDNDKDRLERANIYLMMNRPSMAKKELGFQPKDESSIKRHTLLKAELYLIESRPLDALEFMKDLPVDEETAPVYADIYEAMGSYEAAARILRQSGIEGVEQRIVSCEKLAQERRLVKGRYFVEGRS